ncbi:MAG TPA: isoprenylcysteine carboxylmethyltransferase family protein [Vicinamibacterales bacterium]|jgi:methyltransferase
MTAAVPALAAITFGTMLGETSLSSRHARALRARGAVEPAGDVYRAMALAYPGAFAAIFVEGLLRGSAVDGWFTAGLGLLVAAKALKYWAIATLGERWTFRVLVPPRSTATSAGPYRWLTHPNYLAVVGELAGAGVAAHAPIAGVAAVVGFGLLIRRRIAIEDIALAQR